MEGEKIYLGYGVYVEPLDTCSLVSIEGKGTSYFIDFPYFGREEELRKLAILHSIYKVFSNVPNGPSYTPEDVENSKRIMRALEDSIKGLPENMQKCIRTGDVNEYCESKEGQENTMEEETDCRIYVNDWLGYEHVQVEEE